MTISSTASEISYDGNGATVAFPIPFPFDTSADIKVTSTVTATGDVSVLSSGFSITGGGGSTGTITFTIAPASTVSITLIDDPARTQPTDYVANDAFPAESHERALDRVTRLCKRLYQRSLRSLRVPDGDPVTDAELAPVSTRKGKYLFFDAITGAIDYATAIATTTLSQGTIGALLYPRTAAEIAAGVTPTNYGYPPGDVRRYGAVLDGTTDDTTSLSNAILALNGKGDVWWRGTIKVTSQIVLTAGVRMIGEGYSENNGTGAGNRGASCVLRAFTGANATILASGDDCGVDGIDIDNNNQGTGECLQVTGSRFVGGAFSCRNSGGDGFRIGKTESGASTINANAWSAQKVIVCGNAGAGMRLDHTNTSTTASYPLGITDVNAGYCGLVDARSNGTDGLQIGNANDNVFSMVASQDNTGCGIRFKTDGTNSGPRCNHILGNDCEANTGNDIQIDAATLPVSGPGLYNVILGNRSVAISSRIVDNSTGSYVQQWYPGLAYRAYHVGSDMNVVNTGGQAGYNMNVGANVAVARLYALVSGTVDSIARIAVRKNGGVLTDGCEVNQNAVFQPLNDQVTVAYSASITIDASTGHLFDISANNGTAFTINAPTNPTNGQRIYITVRNTSGGALGAITWNAVFKMVALTSPANGFSRTLFFKYNGTNWVQMRTDADVPN